VQFVTVSCQLKLKSSFAGSAIKLNLPGRWKSERENMEKRKVKVELPVMYPAEKEFNAWVAGIGFLSILIIIVVFSIWN
tara:strand:- start:66 stop:302 length:237 start_codon:yes stop_codon:yes gene_type:complete